MRPSFSQPTRLALTGKIPGELELLGTKFYRRGWCGNSLLTRSVGEGFNHPFPTEVPILVPCPNCAASIPDLHLPAIVVSRNCEDIREDGRKRYSAQHSSQKCMNHFSFHETPFGFLFKTICSINLFMARAVDFAVPPRSHTALPLLDRWFPHTPFICPSKLAVKLFR